MDLIESICLLQQEGFEVSFVHRSFQEYFAAVFIANSATGFVSRYLDDADFQTFDNVLPMLMGIAQQRVESEWAVPKVAELCEAFPIADRGNEDIDLYVSAYPDFDFLIIKSGAVLTHIKQTKLARDVRILQTLYPEQFDIRRDDEEDERTMDYYVNNEWERNIANALVEMEDAGSEQLKGVRRALADAESKVQISKRPKFKVTSGHDTEPLFRAVFGSSFGKQLEALNRVAAVQKERQSRSNAFLGEVFGPLEVE
jgi:hypothetical protein